MLCLNIMSETTAYPIGYSFTVMAVVMASSKVFLNTKFLR